MYAIVMTKKKLQQIEARIERIKAELTTIGPMRPGSLTKQYKDRENLSGAYYQISYTLNMRSRTDYVRKEFVRDVQRQLDNYKRFKELSAEWIELGIEHSKISMKLERSE